MIRAPGKQIKHKKSSPERGAFLCSIALPARHAPFRSACCTNETMAASTCAKEAIYATDGRKWARALPVARTKRWQRARAQKGQSTRQMVGTVRGYCPHAPFRSARRANETMAVSTCAKEAIYATHGRKCARVLPACAVSERPSRERNDGCEHVRKRGNLRDRWSEVGAGTARIRILCFRSGGTRCTCSRRCAGRSRRSTAPECAWAGTRCT